MERLGSCRWRTRGFVVVVSHRTVGNMKRTFTCYFSETKKGRRPQMEMDSRLYILDFTMINKNVFYSLWFLFKFSRCKR